MGAYNIQFDFTLAGDKELLKALPAYRKQLPKVCRNAMQRVLRKKVTLIKKRIKTESGIGRTIWGRHGKGAGLDKLVYVGKPFGSEDGITLPVKLKGLPAMIEKGGKTAKHPITPTRGGRLAFPGTKQFAGQLILAKAVNHPGAHIRSHGFASQVLSNAGPEIIAEVSASIAKLKQKLFGAGAAA